MNNTDPLKKIVVAISRDCGETISGTGFYISNDNIATCYHVLEEEGESLKKTYWVRHDQDNDWKKATLIKYLPLPEDVAVLKTSRKLESYDPKRLQIWNKKQSKFKTRGYGNIEDASGVQVGATEIEGEIVAETSIHEGKYNSRRLQLKTSPEAIKGGRSGSPVFSLDQNAIVGMIDYQAELCRDVQMGTAIPIEAVVDVKPLPIEGALINVPELPPNFLPRPADLDVIKKAILADAGQTMAITGTSSNIGLHGMGGIGKSVLAAAVARDSDVRRHFKDGIFWLTISTDPNITGLQSTLTEMLGQRQYFKDAQDGRAYLSKHLADKACLIILDDVWKADDVKALFSDLGPDCRILITTRDARIITALGAREYSLDVLKPDEALELLARCVGEDVASLPSEASLIVEECGGLPLALTLCGAQVKDGVGWKDLLDALLDADLEFLDHPQGSVMKSMKVSVDKLQPDESECYRKLAVFPPDEALPEDAILRLWGYANKLRDRDGRRIISVLDRKALLKKSERAGKSVIELHDLQHDYLQAICKDLKSLHGLMVEAYRKTSRGGWHTGPNDDYFFQHLAYHLSNAGKDENLRALLFDIDWMRARVRTTDVTGLIHDYDFLSSQPYILEVQGAIRLSAHVISRDPNQIPGQLMGRLKDNGSVEIHSFLDQMPGKVHYPWIRPLSQSLTPPGGPLIQTLQGHAGPVLAVAISPDGKKAVSGSRDETLKVWDLESGRNVMTLQGHTSSVLAVAITPDSKKAVSGSDDDTLKVWDLEDGRILAEFTGESAISSVALAADGRTVVAGEASGRVHLLSLENLDA